MNHWNQNGPGRWKRPLRHFVTQILQPSFEIYTSRGVLSTRLKPCCLWLHGRTANQQVERVRMWLSRMLQGRPTGIPCLGSPWGRGKPLGSPWGALGDPREPFGDPWDILGCRRGALGGPRGALGGAWGALRGPLGVLEGPLGVLVAPFGVPWGAFGGFLGCLGGSLGPLGCFLSEKRHKMLKNTVFYVSCGKKCSKTPCF